MLRAPLTPEDKTEEVAFLYQPLKDSKDSEGQKPSPPPPPLPYCLCCQQPESLQLSPSSSLRTPFLQMPRPLCPQTAPAPSVSTDFRLR